MTEFWNELLIRASWERLQELSKEFDFVLIGGWAIFLWTGRQKSKDIDIMVDFETLSRIREKYALTKNERLRKYEIRSDEFDVDIYLPYYSKLAMPMEELEKFTVKVKGIRTVTPESLLILKQGAEMERRKSVKGQKDAIDILTLLLYGDVDLNRYKGLLDKYGLVDYLDQLILVVKGFDPKDSRFLDMEFKQFTDWRRKYLERLKALR